MNFMHRAALAALAVVTPSFALAAGYPYESTQKVPTAELQRYIYQARYPGFCLSADTAARNMRAKPSTDPAAMHAIMTANIPECANTNFAQSNLPTFTTAIFGAAAAALIAARHEAGPAAIADATHARNWGADLAKMTRDNGEGTPSMYRTDAGRISRDAIALLAAIEAVPAAADAFPAHVSHPKMLPH
jgi:hypothetical protein